MTTNETKQENPVGSDNRISKPARTKKKAWLDIFCEARFEPLRQNLGPENQAKWDSFSYDKKCSVVQSMVRKGHMI